MRLVEVVQLVLVLSSLVLSIQSFRLLVSSKLKVSLFFSLLFFGIALLNVTELTGKLVDLPSGTVERALLMTISLLCFVYICYVELKNRMVFWLVLVLGATIVFIVSLASNLAQALALMLPVLALAVHMIVQTKESTGQLIALVRMMLLTASVISVAWAVYIVYIVGSRLDSVVPYVFSSALLFTVLALTSFLTPIHIKDSVKQTVY